MNDTDSRFQRINSTFFSERLMRRRKRQRAFTRIELLAVSVALLLVALVMAPAAVSSKSDSERLVCFNNLRLVGRGIQTWAGDHNMQFSWRTLSIDGGSLPFSGSKPGNAWLEYSWISNELVTPKILICPSDSGAKRAADWRQFMSAQFRQNSVSYPLNLDGSIDVPPSWLSGDRNFSPTAPGGGCSARVNDAYLVATFAGRITWTNSVHGSFGHVLTTDGTVEFTSSERLTEILATPSVDDNGQTHFLRAR